MDKTQTMRPVWWWRKGIGGGGGDSSGGGGSAGGGIDGPHEALDNVIR